jgi:hypothetical protein
MRLISVIATLEIRACNFEGFAGFEVGLRHIDFCQI